jgi:hypothetical protein
MGSKNTHHRPTFAEIVAEVDATPSSPLVTTTEAEPGKYSGSTLYDPDGHALVEAGSRDLSPEELRAAVLDGARLAWDDCGCGAYCNAIEWPSPADTLREAERGVPRYQKNAGVHVRLLTGNGGDVVLAAGKVRWGDLLQ